MPPAGLAQTAVAFTEKRRKLRPSRHSEPLGERIQPIEISWIASLSLAMTLAIYISADSGSIVTSGATSGKKNALGEPRREL